MSKKVNLVNIFDSSNDQNNDPQERSNTFLSNSTIPTYEEFSNKSAIQKKPKTLLETTSLLTDDESDDDEDENEQTVINKKKNFKIIGSPAISMAASASATKPLLNVVKTPRTPFLPKHLNIQSPKVPQSPGDYILCSHRQVQTSFCDDDVWDNNETKDESATDTAVIIEDSFEFDKEKKQPVEESHSVIIINDSIDEEEQQKPSNNENEVTTNDNFKLKLSTLSIIDEDETSIVEENPMPKTTAKKLSFVINEETKPRRSKTCKKRVSICGEGFSDDVLQIDDTIIDEYENELDHKSGMLFTLVESQIERDLANSTNSKPGVLSSTKMSKIHEEDSEENSSDELENFFKTYKKPSPKKPAQNRSLSDFIVESDDYSSSTSSSGDSTSQAVKNQPVKTATTTEKKFKRIVAAPQTSSSSDSDKAVATKNKEDSSSSSDDSDLYGKDLQLFYIRMNNQIDKNDNTKKSDKKPSKRPTFYNNSSDSELSDRGEKSSSSSDSSSDEEHRPDVFRRNYPINEPAKSIFKTPAKVPNKDVLRDQRLIKTSQCVAKHREPLKKNLSFVESLSTVVPNEEHRDPSVKHYIQRFRLKKVKEELLKMLYEEFNAKVFEKQLPSDMKLAWNGRLSSTAGYCRNQTRLGVRTCEIHISGKICTTPERLRDTLAHEMCHAASFMINLVNDGHGKIWRGWANLFTLTYPDMPKITVTHTYFIEKKFIFKCTQCQLQINRFSKSIDIEKEVCGLCHGRFEILRNDLSSQTKAKEIEMEELFERIRNNELMEDSGAINRITSKSKQISDQADLMTTPRALSKFAIYVKENYNLVKKDFKLQSHKEVMQELSKNFKQLSTK